MPHILTVEQQEISAVVVFSSTWVFGVSFGCIIRMNARRKNLLLHDKQNGQPDHVEQRERSIRNFSLLATVCCITLHIESHLIQTKKGKLLYDNATSYTINIICQFLTEHGLIVLKHP